MKTDTKLKPLTSTERSVNAPRRGDWYTDCSAIFRTATESSAVLPNDRMLDNLQCFRICATKILPPCFPGVTVRKLTRLGNLPADKSHPRLLRVVLSTPEERQALLRFAFKLKGTGVIVYLDLPLADRLQLREAAKDLEARRETEQKGLLLVGFQVVSRRSTSALPEPVLVAHDPGLTMLNPFR
ncbi:unnamed protein product [Dicrocoelium dendriticum]|nr:unnamed protein product [Dicrocoelium dendriticum]